RHRRPPPPAGGASRTRRRGLAGLGRRPGRWAGPGGRGGAGRGGRSGADRPPVGPGGAATGVDPFGLLRPERRRDRRGRWHRPGHGQEPRAAGPGSGSRRARWRTTWRRDAMTPTAPDRHDDGFQDDLAALATGTLTGRRRVEMLDHLESCPACAAELDELSGTVDVLMSLAPEAEPPAGFAERTVALMRADKRQMGEQPAEGSAGDTAGHSVIVPLATHRQRRGRPVHRALAVAAVVVALALGVGIGALVAGSGGPGTGSPGTATGTPGVRTATLQSASGGGGSVVLTPGRPGWLVMTVEDAGAWG